MKRLAAVIGAVTLSLVLSGCGSASYSFNEGYHEGQDLAANVPASSLVTTAARSVCRHDWVIDGSVSMIKAPWLQGCIRGFDAVVTVVAEPRSSG